MKPLTEIKNVKTKQRINYSKNILDGIDHIDKTTCYELIKSIIPSALKSGKTPYMPIRQLLNFFDPHTGARRQMAGGAARFCDCFMLFENLVDLLNKINRLDNELVSIVYSKDHKYSASELIDNVKWRMSDTLTTLQQFMVEFNNSGLSSRFADIEALKGSLDGKRIGLFKILFRANTNMEEIVDFLDKIDSIITKGHNPLTY